MCAFYTPSGGGVRTYVDAKLKAAARFGHEMIVIAPGERDSITRVGPGAVLATIASPTPSAATIFADRSPRPGRRNHMRDDHELRQLRPDSPRCHSPRVCSVDSVAGTTGCRTRRKPTEFR